MVTKVSATGQVTIPAPLRTKYGFSPGTTVVWVERDGDLIPHPIKSVISLYGSLRPQAGQQSLVATLLEERRAERDREDN